MRRIDHRLGLAFLTGVFIGSLVAACGGGTATPTPTPIRSHSPGGDFYATGSMTMGRDSHTATLLQDGRVLVAGGEGAKEARSAELYDPKTGKFKATGSMVGSHVFGTATLLLDGRVLFVGGWEIDEGSRWSPYDATRRSVSATAELYDPKTGKFAPTGSPVQGRYFHTATRLQDGRVLIAGGVLGANDNPDATATDTAEIYDPGTGKFSATGSMTTARYSHTATLLKDGHVLLVGSRSAELYDPVKGEFSLTGSMPSQSWMRVAALLQDGRVLIAGGGEAISLAEIYDPGTGQFSPTGSMIHTGNFLGPYGTQLDSAPVLPNGRVLVPDDDYGEGVSGVELYDPATGTFTEGPHMSGLRSGFTETLLADGSVLFTGNQHPVYPMGVAPPTDPDTLAATEADRASAQIYVP